MDIDAIYVVEALGSMIVIAVTSLIIGLNIIYAIGIGILIAAFWLAIEITAEKYCLKKLKKAKAISPDSAVTPEEAKIDPGPLTDRALTRLLRRKKVEITDNDRYYVSA